MNARAPLLSAAGIAKAFGRRRVLSGVSLEARGGEIVCLVGENGTGKSTLLKILGGWIAPDRGTVARRGRVGYCPQETLVFPNLSVQEHFRYFAAAYRLPRWQESAAALLDVFGFADSAGRRAGELSGGTRQKLNLCLALLPDAELLLLDEPYSGFDWDTYQRFWQEAAEYRRRGKAIVIVSHFVHPGAPVDRVLSLSAGGLR